MHELFETLGLMILFIALTPSILFRIPKNGSLMKVAAVHAALFGFLIFIWKKMNISEPLSVPAWVYSFNTNGSATHSTQSIDPSGTILKCTYKENGNMNTTYPSNKCYVVKK